MSDKLVIRGAREHNLKNVSLELPRDKLIVFTGLSGSGKSSLAFDTIYAEGQRRYVESLSAYARQFLGQMDKPDVDFIEGLSPAISIDQKSASRNPRSTVGTITEIYDYLRLLYARIGVPHCPNVRRGRHPPDAAADRRPHPRAARGHPLPGAGAGGAGPQGRVRGPARRPGQAGLRPGPRRRRDRSSWPRRERPKLAPLREAHHRGRRRPARAARRASSAGSPTRWRPRCGWPRAWPRSSSSPHATARRPSEDATLTFSQHLACPNDGTSFDELAPRNFSFNSPYGACPHCDGLGTRFEVDPELVVPNPDLVVDEGAIAPWAGARGEYFHRVLAAVAESYGFSTTTPWKKLKKAEQKVLLYGSGTKQVHVQYRNRYGRTRSYYTHYEGVRPVPAAPPHRGRVRLVARADRGLHARGAVPRVRRRPAQARVARRHRRRPQHLRAVRPVDRARRPRCCRASSCPSATA